MTQLKIIQARYGPIEYGQWVDVKPKLERFNGVDVVVGDVTFTTDAQWGNKKRTLSVVSRRENGTTFEAEFEQGEIFKLSGIKSDNWEEVVYATRKPRTIGQGVENVVRADGVATGESKATEIGDGNSGLRIVSARYGVLGAPMPFRDHSIDVAERVRSLVKDGSLDIVVANSTLTPNENPYRGKKKVLLLTYSLDGGEPVTVERAEKDWLIIGPVQSVGSIETAQLVAKRDGREDDVRRAKLYAPEGVNLLVQTTAAGLNDYLIRRFQISPQRLRAPMPIELPNFHRNDLAKLFAELGFQRGAEIGVAEGKYSEVLLKANPDLELLLVDPWHHYSDNPQGKSKERHEFAYSETKRRTELFKMVRIAADYSMNAVRMVDNGSLDFCYVDACHSFDFVMQDLIEWSKRVRPGGIVSGDDYYQLSDRWGAGPVEAVQAYTQAHRIPVWYIFQGHKSVDFMWVKP